MTRLKGNDGGSHLIVVNVEPRLDRYGKSWPESVVRDRDF